MNREATGVGKTVEEALENAYKQLGVDGDNSEFEILERPKRSLFGLKVTPAKVKVTVNSTEAPAARPQAARPQPPRPQQTPPRPPIAARPQPPAANRPAPPRPPQAEGAQPAPQPKAERPPVPAGTPATGEKVDTAVKYLTDIFADMDLGAVDIKAFATTEGAVLTLTGDGLGVLIGRRGETLDALQYLSGLVANRMEGEYFRITIDSGNYREKRERTLELLAKKLSSQVLKNGRSMTLEPMNPYERRIIHATVQNIDGVSSSSIGEEPNRRVVISSANSRRPFPPKDSADAKGQPRRPAGRSGGVAPRPGTPPRDGKPHEFRRNTNTAADVVTRPGAGAFSESMRAAQPAPRPFVQTAPKKRIDDSQFEIEPPVRTAAAVKPEAAKAPAVVAPEKPLYSKIDID